MQKTATERLASAKQFINARLQENAYKAAALEDESAKIEDSVRKMSADSNSLRYALLRYGPEMADISAQQRAICERNQLLREVLAELEGDVAEDAEDRVAVGWCVDDVKGIRPDLTNEQCRSVLHRLVEKHDANVGINWDVIEEVAEMMFPATEE